MLDVHPPEHTPHSWKDSLLPIATICTGLLMAIGFEQTAKALQAPVESGKTVAAFQVVQQSAPHAGTPSGSPLEQQVLAADSAWANAENFHDLATLDGLLDDSCVITGTSGRTETKQEFLKQFSGEVKAVMTQDLVDRAVHLHGDTAIVTETDNYTYAKGGHTSTGSLRLTTTYLQRGDRWVAIAEQVNAPPSKPAPSAATVAIVGAWFVKIPAAPFPYHLFVFHTDGTVIQSNPDSGDPGHSDSNLMGAWSSAGGTITAKLVETSADRTTHQFVSRTELTMSLEVQGNTLHGTGTASAFGAAGKPDGTPRPFTFDGDRILP
jgi:ketosteroid isomerase-like protein